MVTKTVNETFLSLSEKRADVIVNMLYKLERQGPSSIYSEADAEAILGRVMYAFNKCAKVLSKHAIADVEEEEEEPFSLAAWKIKK